MSAVTAYGLGLALAIGVVMALGSRGLWLAATVLAIEWALSNAAVQASGRFDPAEAFAFIHFLAAVCLLRDERHSGEVIIGGIYLVLFVVDGSYMIAHAATGSADMLRYLNWTAGGGWAQIAVLTAGGLADGRRQWRRAGALGAGIVLAGAAVAASVAAAAS
jgi:hypothetical protein